MMTKKNSLIFRFHRGGLAESLATAIEIFSIDELQQAIKDSGLEFEDIKIEKYGTGIDFRINWDTYIVTVKVINFVFGNTKIHSASKQEYLPVGFLSGNPEILK